MQMLKIRKLFLILFMVSYIIFLLTCFYLYKKEEHFAFIRGRNFTQDLLESKIWRAIHILNGLTSDSPVVIYHKENNFEHYENNFNQVIALPYNKTNVMYSVDDSIDALQDVKLWFMKGGSLRPKPTDQNSKSILWPEQSGSDRIVEQLMYTLPRNIVNQSILPQNLLFNSDPEQKLKKILLYFGKGWKDLKLGRTHFLDDGCPVSTCELTIDRKDAENADAIFFKEKFRWPSHKRTADQVWILFLLESPLNSNAFKNLKYVINWTATYRHDSDLVTPYEKFVPYNISNLYSSSYKNMVKLVNKNYAATKKKKIAWFVSNCFSNSERLEYAKELGQHIEVDIYGMCGNKTCLQIHKCFEMLDRDYKFYLAFENSHCKDYITEKFFVNALSNNIVPIVLGAPPEDYARVAPTNSYIHVDDFAFPKKLADYLHVLDEDDALYNEYFSWKGTGEFVNTHFWCRVCALLHAAGPPKSYPDLQEWWSGPEICRERDWQRYPIDWEEQQKNILKIINE